VLQLQVDATTRESARELRNDKSIKLLWPKTGGNACLLARFN